MGEFFKGKTIAIIGGGLIGRSWAMVFASGGYRVKIYDIQAGQARRAQEDISKEMRKLQDSGFLRGLLSAEEQTSLISSHDDLKETLESAFFIQECIYENLSAKQEIFCAVESHVADGVILSSSTSCILPTNVFSKVKNRKRCIVSHPVNPPYYVKLVELVPHPETDSTVVDVTYNMMKEVGQSPVRLRREIDGFALNRIQYAVIAEAWRLVKDGILSVQDVDAVMSEGLGMRYAFVGPMETVHLNAEGLQQYFQQYGEGIKRVLSSFGPVPDFSDEELKKIDQEMCNWVPCDPQNLAARRERRDRYILGLSQLKSKEP
ncbi:lambda-crystallin homolog [Polypterus senegalus]|uniref:lambda-crystallin homolog n=1 Tax=Polypterus senegalus TaxID=55291 RepID=UPI0019659D43|nr:lambda-crystallin homolog [Polypterus senegalus]